MGRFVVLGLVLAVSLVVVPGSVGGSHRADRSPIESAIFALKHAVLYEGEAGRALANAESIKNYTRADEKATESKMKDLMSSAIDALDAAKSATKSSSLEGSALTDVTEAIGRAREWDARVLDEIDSGALVVGVAHTKLHRNLTNAGEDKQLALKRLEAPAAAHASADLGCTVSPGQSIVAANETAFTISGCKTVVAKIELKLDRAFVDRTPAGVVSGSSYRTVDCGHGPGTDLVCANVNAPAGATIVEGVAGLKAKEAFVATISGANGAAQVIKGALPRRNPLSFTAAITKDATPNTYTFAVTPHEPFQRIWFALPPGAQVLYETQPGNGMSAGAQTQADGTVEFAFVHIGVSYTHASSFKTTYRSTVTFAGATPWPATLKDGGDGIAALSSSTGHASVH